MMREPLATSCRKQPADALVVPYETVVERLGSKAYFLATQDQIVALAGWRAENLVGRIDDLVIYPGSARPTAGRALFEQIEKEARKLECEVLLPVCARHRGPSSHRLLSVIGIRAPPDG